MDNEEGSSSSSAVKQVVRKTLIIENIGMATTADDLTRCFAPALQKCGKDRPVIQLAIDKKGRSLGYATVTVPLSTVELFLDFNDRYINNNKVRVMLGDKRVGTWQSQGNGVFMSSPARRSTADTVTCNTTFVHSLIDGGMYLRHKKFKVPDHVIAAALTDGTDKLVSLGKSVFHSQEALKLSQLFSGAVYCTAGVSPRNAVFWTDETSRQLEEIAKSPGCVAIGQCGYDLSTDQLVDTAVPQLQAFEAQIQLAIRLSMPLVVCENKAKSEVMALLTSYKDKLPRVAILATPASQDDITDYLDHGFYFFITGDMWKPGSSSPVWSWLLACTAEQLTRVILSSQMPMTGCQTSLSSLAEAVASKTGKELEDVRGILRDNTMRFYGLSEVESQGEEGGINTGCRVAHPTVSCEVTETQSGQVSAEAAGGDVLPAGGRSQHQGDVQSTSSPDGEGVEGLEDNHYEQRGHLVSEADISSSKVGTGTQHEVSSCVSDGSKTSVPQVGSQKDGDQTVNVETNWTYRILLWLAFVSGLAAMYFYGN